MITLYDMERSGNAYKARLMLGLLGLAYTKHTVDLAKKQQMEPWYLAINPLHTVPAIDDDGTIVRDSNAVLVYLAAKYDQERTWYPADPAGMARIQQWLAYANNEILNTLAPARAIALGIRPGNLDEARDKARPALAHLEASLKGRDWLEGDKPTVADVACFVYPALVEIAGALSLSAYPSVAAWCRRIDGLKGFVALPRVVPVKA